jgi:tRNA threonylcarbamoyladenosine biosynthesis protein TsaE
MNTHILKEGDWENFIQETVLPIIMRPRNKFGVTNATVFALVGDLGAGKTTFSKTFLKELGVKQHVQSPTFSIINSYEISFDEYEKVFHIDTYRIEDIKELEVLHIDEILSNPKHIIVIEWADKIKAHIPQDAVWMYFEHDTLETRKVKFTHE